jgi:glycosyltransferase involved in cell wall biosynthesis
MAPGLLISFYIIACNQERFIREAVAGALAQTWTPLEVMLSDDCSDDSTFSVMEEMVQFYSGPHRIVLNRNEKRLGVGAHINRVLQLCTGEWIVASAGDDVSAPERIARLYEEWQLDGCRAGLIYSNLIETLQDGGDWYARDFRKEAPDGQVRWNWTLKLSGSTPPVHGATFAYPRRTFEEFGPLWDGIVFEDNVLNWRAELSGGVLLCPDYLVRHRNHSGQVTNRYSRQALLDAGNRRHILARSDLVSRRQNLADAKIAMERGLISPGSYPAIEKRLTAELNNEAENYELSWGCFSARWKLLFRDFPSVFRRKRLSQVLFAALPRPLYILALKAMAMWK